MSRLTWKITDYDALEAHFKDRFPGLVKVVTEKREDKKLMRQLLKSASALKQEVPGVIINPPKKKVGDDNQTDPEQKIMEASAKETKPDPTANTRFAAPGSKSAAKPAPASPVNKKRA